MLLTSSKAHLSVCANFLIPSIHITATVFFGVGQTRQPFGRFYHELGLVIQCAALQYRGKHVFIDTGMSDSRMKTKHTIFPSSSDLQW
jgi:hypothetical protein